MSAPAFTTSDFGLNRGRRVLAGMLVAVALGWGGVLGWRAAAAPAGELPSAPAAAPVVEAPTPVKAKSKTVAKTSRKAKAARVVAQRAPALAAVTPAAAAPSPPPAPTPEAPAPAAANPPDDAPAFAAFPGETAGAPPPMPAPEPVAAAAEEDEADLGNGEAIARSIAADQRAAVRSCFERELKTDPKLQGTVAVELDLLPPNRIGSVRVTDDLERPAFTDCVSAAMRHARFKALNEEVSVRVPYVLSAERK